MPQRRTILEGPGKAPAMEFPDRPDALSEVERLLGVALGLDEPVRGAIPDGIATLGSLMPAMAILKKLSTMSKAGKAAKAASQVPRTVEDVAAMKANLPAEFMALPEEEAAYNALRLKLHPPFKPSNEGDFVLRNHMAKQGADPIREARLKNAAEGKPSKLRKPDGK